MRVKALVDYCGTMLFVSRDRRFFTERTNRPLEPGSENGPRGYVESVKYSQCEALGMSA